MLTNWRTTGGVLLATTLAACAQPHCANSSDCPSDSVCIGTSCSAARELLWVIQGAAAAGRSATGAPLPAYVSGPCNLDDNAVDECRVGVVAELTSNAGVDGIDNVGGGVFSQRFDVPRADGTVAVFGVSDVDSFEDDGAVTVFFGEAILSEPSGDPTPVRSVVEYGRATGVIHDGVLSVRAAELSAPVWYQLPDILLRTRMTVRALDVQLRPSLDASGQIQLGMGATLDPNLIDPTAVEQGASSSTWAPLARSLVRDQAGCTLTSFCPGMSARRAEVQ
jgi:hypothetical protein